MLVLLITGVPSRTEIEDSALEFAGGRLEERLPSDIHPGPRLVLVALKINVLILLVHFSLNHGNITIALRISPLFMRSYAAGRSSIPMKSETKSLALTWPFLRAS